VESTSFTPPTIEALNELLPAYHFIDFIAQGGMGAVYRAKQISLDREVAVKILPRELSEDPEFRSSFQTEARAMARLNHPNLISIYDSGDVDGMLYIAMEYVPGKSLYHSSWNKKIDPKEASRIIIAICDGLSHAHENGIIHRDIKPANILLTPKIEPKIGDFGLAQRVGVKHDGIVMGTPGYSAPEVISHPEKADRRSDIFAVGVMLHELLTGQKPEPNVTASSLCKCSPDFDTVIQRATHPNPVMRYPDASSMAKAIQEVLENKGKSNPMLATGMSARGSALVKPQAMGRSVAMKSASATPASGRPSSVATPGVSPDEPEDLALPPLVIKSGNASWSYVRNLLVIAALCVVVVFVYQKLQIHRANVAKAEQEYEVKQKEEDMRRRREVAEEMARMQNEPIKNTQENPGINTRPPVIEEKKETAMESLERLQYDLSKGSRAEMPIGARRRGELDFFLVTEAMTWDEALLFSEKNGAHIALPTSEDDLTFFTSLLKNNETIWLGAGRSGRDKWIMLDGSPWALSKTPSGLGGIATLSHLGVVRAGESARELPFVIAWHRDGSNPCSLANLLQVSRKSLDGQSPIYPPGTMAVDSRHYLPILRPMKYSEALNLAQQAGAHIAALSNREESYWVKDNLGSIEAPRGIFLGGEKSGGVWQWSTREAWTYADWAPDSPSDDEDATLLVYLPKRGWHNVDKHEQADGVLLEWSKDAQSTGPSSANLSSAAPDLAGLITKCRELVSSSAKERNDKLAANLKSFQWDLDVWLRGLKPLEKPQWQETVHILQALARKGRVPSAQEVADAINGEGGALPPMHAGIIEIHTYSFKKQTEIDQEHVARNGKIRDSYVTKIKEIGANAQKSGQLDLVRQMKEYLEDATDLDSWVSNMLDD
jgi:serine/threonine protein kinase